MDTKKIRVGILYGGKSPEHEVSLFSAKNVMDAVDTDTYEVVPMLIPKTGEIDFEALKNVDVVFPVLHGANGEDGRIQGLLQLMDIPFVGPDVLGSAVAMDKDVAKRLLNEAGIANAKFVVLHQGTEYTNTLGWPVFVKPARQGSSVGVGKAKNAAELEAAIADAFRYDTKIIIEEYIEGDEVECAILGNEHPSASIPGAIIPHHEFYSYEAKYIDPNGAELQIPAKISPEIAEQVKKIAIKTFQVLGLEGMSRIDVRIRNGTEIIVNEANTIPGFTNISMYPKLWEASGVSYSDLISQLIELGLSRHARDKKLKTSFDDLTIA